MSSLNEGQQKALRFIQNFMRGSDKMMCFNCPSGYGKTFTLNHLKSTLAATNTKNRLLSADSRDFNEVLMCATTAKAASLISGAKTIHKRLGLYVWKDFSTGKTHVKSRQIQLPENCIVVVDEASMIDQDLMYHVEDHISNYNNVKYIFVGDEAQLKPVGTPYSVFQQGFPTVSLTQPMRQSEDSSLFQACQALRSAVFNKPVKVGTSPDICRIAAEDLREYLTTADLSETKIVTYQNKQAIRYNQLVRRLRGLPAEWTIGDYVVVRNFYEPNPIPLETVLCIGSFGPNTYVQGIECLSIYFACGRHAHVAVNPAEIPAALKVAKADRDWNAVKELQEYILDIRDAAAGTCHTAQGSTYDTVIVDVSDIKQCWDKDTRNRMLYTAVSRARKQVYLV